MRQFEFDRRPGTQGKREDIKLVCYGINRTGQESRSSISPPEAEKLIQEVVVSV